MRVCQFRHFGISKTPGAAILLPLGFYIGRGPGTIQELV
jgi:hypothetical protein